MNPSLVAALLDKHESVAEADPDHTTLAIGEELEKQSRLAAPDVVQRALRVIEVLGVSQPGAVDSPELGDTRAHAHSFGRRDTAIEPHRVEFAGLEKRAA